MVLMGRALRGHAIMASLCPKDWALIGQALMGRALIGWVLMAPPCALMDHPRVNKESIALVCLFSIFVLSDAK